MMTVIIDQIQALKPKFKYKQINILKGNQSQTKLTSGP